MQDDSTCNACPVVASSWDQYRGLLVIVGALVVIVLVVWIGLLLLVRLRGGTLTGGASRMASLGVWMFMTVQVREREANVLIFVQYWITLLDLLLVYSTGHFVCQRHCRNNTSSYSSVDVSSHRRVAV